MNKYQVAYLRFVQQVKALKKGKLNTVKKLAQEAKDEIKFQSTGQAYFSFRY